MGSGVHVGCFMTGTGTSDLPVTGVGFQPKAIIFTGVQIQTSPSCTGDLAEQSVSRQFLGFSSGAGENVCCAWTTSGSVGNNDVESAHEDSWSIMFYHASGTLKGKARVKSFDSDGFTIEFDTAFDPAAAIQYLALSDTVAEEAHADVLSSSGSIGTQDFTDPGFEPNVVLFSSVGLYDTSSIVNHFVRMFGFMDADGNEGVMLDCCEGGGDRVYHYMYDGECVAFSNDGTSSIKVRAEFSAMLSNGFRLNFLEDSAGSRMVIYLALKLKNYASGNDQFETTATTIEVDMGFPPQAVMVVSGSLTSFNTQDTMTYGTVQQSIGFAEGVSDRRVAHMFSPRDDYTPRLPRMHQRDSAIALQTTFSDTPNGIMDIDSFDADSVTFVMDDAADDALIFFYIGFGLGPSPANVIWW
jgi:hypothetical protein